MLNLKPIFNNSSKYILDDLTVKLHNTCPAAAEFINVG